LSIGKAREGFDLDLKHGQSREDAISAILRGEKLVEVKSDGKCRSTGNLFIEFEQKGRPSGIAVTKAGYYAFEYNDDEWLIVPTAKLKRVARQYFKMGEVKSGGDNNNYKGVLVPVTALVDARLKLVE
jgi:hypothetical protein